ncbi:MAG: hypothetical protein L3J17_15875 [Candidatus Jettenia sp.]|nr:MAG: hypothetical protein L3J17_15875 [Candidatus Jettenia sp.]
MEAWSDSPIIDNFRINFYLDTMILSYLLDKTYPCLTQTIEFLKNCPFSDLVSSHYVIFEFVGIRKREHYLRELVKKCQGPEGTLNMSSLLKYKDDFSAPEVKFEDIQLTIKTKVEEELSKITKDFSIEYSKNIIHNGLLQPTFDICLSSKISKEDSLVLCSAVLPNEQISEDFVLILSNDRQFVQDSSETKLNEIFRNHSIKKPLVEYLKDFKLEDGTKIDLTISENIDKVPDFVIKKLKELVIKKNKDLFLGKTIKCASKSPSNTICFNLESNTFLNKDIYIVIIGSDLNFFYSIKARGEFWNHEEIKSYPFQSTSVEPISFLIYDKSDDGIKKELASEIIEMLSKSGNLVFIHPHSL